MRKRPALLSRYRPHEWLVRGSLAGAITVGAYVGVVSTAGYALRTTDVARAHALAPRDGRITGLLAQTLLVAEATPATRLRVAHLAREALRQDPTAVAAATTLGINMQLSGQLIAARRLLAYSERLSRRDLQTQIWAIEDSVARKDVLGALKHYDIALRTSRDAPEVLFPVLSSAISDNKVRTALISVLATRPPWSVPFTDYIAGAAPDQRATADLFMALARVGVHVSEGAQAAVVDTLTAKGALDAAWTYYTTLRPGADRRRSRDPQFAATIDAPTPFDWLPVNEAGINASIQRNGRVGIFDFATSSGVGGAVLRQRQMLPPGSYRLTGHGNAIDQPDETRPYWSLTCQDGGEVGRVDLTNSAQANGWFTGRFVVPAACPVQTLTLIVRPSDMVGGVTGQIDRVELYPTP